MKVLDTALFASQALRRAPMRTSMMLLAIAIGVAAVVTLAGVGEAARRFVTAEFASLGTNSLIVLPFLYGQFVSCRKLSVLLPIVRR